jgi:hypothetical protein
MILDGRSRDELAREANLARSKLLRTVEQLDRKRQEILDVRHQVRKHLGMLVVVSGLFLIATGGTALISVQRIAHAAARRRRERWTLARHAWKRPGRVLRAERLSFPLEVIRSVLLALATTLLSLPVRRLAQALASERRREAAQLPAGGR